MNPDQSVNIRELILRKIQVFPDSLLEEIYRYLLTLEKKPTKKEKILSFAGAWSQMDDQDFDDLLSSIQERRSSHKRNRRKEL